MKIMRYLILSVLFGLLPELLPAQTLRVDLMKDGDVCDGSTVKIKALVAGGEVKDIAYEWRKVGIIHDKTVGVESDLILSRVTVADTGRYYCIVKDLSDKTVVWSDSLRLYYRPIPIVLDDFLYGSEGEKLLAEARDSGGNLLSKDSLTWYKRSGTALWTRLDGMMNPCEFTLGGKDVEIRAVFTNWRQCMATDSLPVYVRASVNFLGGGDDGFALGASNFGVTIDPPLQREFCENDHIILNAHVDGVTDGYIFRWWKVGRPTNSMVGEAAGFELSRAFMSDAGYYFCTAKNADGFTAQSDTVLLIPRQIDIPAAMYVGANERGLSLTVLDGKGDTVRGSIKWEKRLDDSWMPLSVSGTNPYYFSASDRDMSIRATYDCGSCYATDTMPVYVKNFGNTGSGEGDGYAGTLLPPVIRQNIPFKQYCTMGDSVSLAIVAEGKNICYEWQMQSGGEFRRITLGGVQGVDESRLTMTGLRVGLTGEFSGVFRCKVSCGDIVLYSDTAKVFANHQLSMKVGRDKVILSDGVAENVEVALEDGVMPWLYTYTGPLGQNYSSDSLRMKTDHVVVDLIGEYRFISLRDALGCEATENLPSIVVDTVTDITKPKVSLELLSESDICSGGDVYLRVTVRDGVGPWKVWLKTRIDGLLSESDIPGVTMPLLITKEENGRKDISFVTSKSAVYVVDSITDLNGGQGERSGVIEGSGIEVHVLEVDPVRFVRLYDNHIGMCNPVDLFDKLKPNIGGRLLTTGLFKANGEEVTPRNWLPGQAIPYAINYAYTNAQGCLSTTSVELVADARPEATLTLPGNLCAGEEARLQIALNGKDFRFDLEQERISKGAKSTVMRRLVSSGENRGWYEDIRFLPQDSCLIFRLTNLQDKHGCGSMQTSLNALTYYHEIPDVRILARYKNEDDQKWESLPDTIWTFGGAIELRTILTEGELPWNLKIGKTGTSLSMQTGLTVREKENTVTEEGDYLCYVSDRYCRKEEPVKFSVSYKKPAYARLRLFLEGVNAEEEVTVELRRAKSAKEAAEKGVVVGWALCKSQMDGTITDREGSSVIRFNDYGIKYTTESLYLVIRYPGYLPVMSNRAYPIFGDKGKAVLVDFSDSNNVYMTDGNMEDRMTKIGVADGKVIWALSPADTQDNGLISVKDGNIILQKEGHGARLDMTRKNRDKHSE